MTTLIGLIKKHEGTGPVENDRLMPYTDSEGYTTIGYGRCIELVGVSREEAEFLLREDISQSTYECETQFKWFNDLNTVRKDVIVSMVFNLGLPRFKQFTKTIWFIDAGRYHDAANEMLDSKWAKQVGKRSVELSVMMRSGKWL